MKKPTFDQIPTFAQSYFQAAVFTELPERLQRSGEITDWFDFKAAWKTLTRKDQNALLTDCENFRTGEIEKPILDSINDDARTGTDYWFSRNGHGCGFWDRDYGTKEQRDTLHAATKPYGSAYLELYRGRWTYHS